ncbi:MAG: hypothetical protein RJA05_452 [Planctomycetota bacterium]
MKAKLQAKFATIERCLTRIEEERVASGRSASQASSDSIVLNVIRACEAAIDVANIMVAARRLGTADDAREAFQLLHQAGLIDASLCDRMKRMVGFRNVAVHEYTRLEDGILLAVVERHLNDFREFATAIHRAMPGDS